MHGLVLNAIASVFVWKGDFVYWYLRRQDSAPLCIGQQPHLIYARACSCVCALKSALHMHFCIADGIGNNIHFCFEKF